MTVRPTARVRATAVSALLASSLLLVPLAGTAAAQPARVFPPSPRLGPTASTRPRWSGHSPKSPTGTSPRR